MTIMALHVRQHASRAAPGSGTPWGFDVAVATPSGHLVLVPREGNRDLEDAQIAVAPGQTWWIRSLDGQPTNNMSLSAMRGILQAHTELEFELQPLAALHNDRNSATTATTATPARKRPTTASASSASSTNATPRGKRRLPVAPVRQPATKSSMSTLSASVETTSTLLSPTPSLSTDPAPQKAAPRQAWVERGLSPVRELPESAASSMQASLSLSSDLRGSEPSPLDMISRALSPLSAAGELESVSASGRSPPASGPETQTGINPGTRASSARTSTDSIDFRPNRGTQRSYSMEPPATPDAYHNASDEMPGIERTRPGTAPTGSSASGRLILPTGQYGTSGVVTELHGALLHRQNNKQSKTSGELQIIQYEKEANGHFGFLCIGGSDTRASMLGLRKGDRLLAAGRASFLGATHEEAINILNEIHQHAELVVLRTPVDQWVAVCRQARNLDQRLIEDRNAGRTVPTTEFFRSIALPRGPTFDLKDGVTTGTVHRFVLNRAEHKKIGMRVAGGVDTEAGAVFITHIYPIGAAANCAGLHVGSRVLEVNGESLLLTPQAQVRKVMRANGAPLITILVQELADNQYELIYSQTEKAIRLTALPMPGHATAGDLVDFELRRHHGSFGLKLVGGCETSFGAVFVDECADNVWHGDAKLSQGDRLVAVGGVSVISMTRGEVQELLRNAPKDSIHVLVMQVGAEQWKKMSSEIHREDYRTYNKHGIRRLRAMRLKRSQASGGLETSGPLHAISLHRETKCSWGFNIAGGSDTKLGAVFVTRVEPNGLASVKSDLQPGDRVLQVGTLSLLSSTQSEAWSVLKAQESRLDMVVLRLGSSKWAALLSSLKLHRASGDQQPIASSNAQEALDLDALQRIREDLVEKQGTKGLGFLITARQSHQSGVEICQIIPGGNAHRDGRLRAHDVLMAINNTDVSAMSFEQVIAILRKCTTLARFVVLRGGRHRLVATLLRDAICAPLPVPMSGPLRDVESHAGSRLVILRRINGVFPIQLIGRTETGVALNFPADVPAMIGAVSPELDLDLQEGDAILQVAETLVHDLALPALQTLLAKYEHEVTLLVKNMPEALLTLRRALEEETAAWRALSEDADHSVAVERTVAVIESAQVAGERTAVRLQVSEASEGAMGAPRTCLIVRQNGSMGIELVGPRQAGLQLSQTGVFIHNVEPGSYASLTKEIERGDRVMQVEDALITSNMGVGEVVALIQSHEASVHLTLQRDPRAHNRLVFALRHSPDLYDVIDTSSPVAEASLAASQSLPSRRTSNTLPRPPPLELSLDVTPPGSMTGAPFTPMTPFSGLAGLPRTAAPTEKRIELPRNALTGDLGFSLSGDDRVPGPVIVSHIDARGLAAADGQLHINDQVVGINGRTTKTILLSRAKELLAKAGARVTLDVLRLSADSTVESEATPTTPAKVADPLAVATDQIPTRAPRGNDASLASTVLANALTGHDAVPPQGPSEATTYTTITMRHNRHDELGFTVALADPEQERQYTVRVSAVQPTSIAARAGLQPGALLVGVGQHDVAQATLEQVLDLIAQDVNGQVVLRVLQPRVSHSSSAANSANVTRTPSDASIHSNDDVLTPLAAGSTENLHYPGAAEIVRTIPLVTEWNLVSPGYRPTDYTHESVFTNHRADAAQTDAQLAVVRFNQLDQFVDRRSHEGIYMIGSDHRPLCPLGRQGLAGRGLFCHWGPNHAVHVLISRWVRDEDGRMAIVDQRPELEFLALKHQVSGAVFLPGVFIRPGESLSGAIERALNLASKGVAGAVAGTDHKGGKLTTVTYQAEHPAQPTPIGRPAPLAPSAEQSSQALHTIEEVDDDANSSSDEEEAGSGKYEPGAGGPPHLQLGPQGGDAEAAGLEAPSPWTAADELLECLEEPDIARIEIFRGALEDPRNTDNAWLETTALNFHDESGLFADLEFDPEVSPLVWRKATRECPLCPEQMELVYRLASAHQAYFEPRKRRRREAVREFDVILQKASSVPFGFSISTSGQGHHRVEKIAPNGLAFGQLEVGDEILAINGQVIVGWSHRDVRVRITSNANLVLRVSRARESSLHTVHSTASMDSQGHNSGSRKGMGQRARPVSVRIQREWYDRSFGFNVAINALDQCEISKVSSDSPAWSKLQLGDIVTSINDKQVTRLSHQQLVQLCQGKLILNMRILRLTEEGKSGSATSSLAPRRNSSMGRLDEAGEQLVEVDLGRDTLTGGFGFGCGTTESGQHFITTTNPKVVKGSLRAGDRIIRVNSLEGDSLTDERLHEVTEGAERLHLLAIRQRPGLDVEDLEFVSRDFNVGSPAGRDVARVDRGDRPVSIKRLQQRLSSPDTGVLLVQLEATEEGWGLDLANVAAHELEGHVPQAAVMGIRDQRLSGVVEIGQGVLRARRFGEAWFELRSEKAVGVEAVLRVLGSPVELELSRRLFDLEQTAPAIESDSQAPHSNGGRMFKGGRWRSKRHGQRQRQQQRGGPNEAGGDSSLGRGTVSGGDQLHLGRFGRFNSSRNKNNTSKSQNQLSLPQQPRRTSESGERGISRRWLRKHPSRSTPLTDADESETASRTGSGEGGLVLGVNDTSSRRSSSTNSHGIEWDLTSENSTHRRPSSRSLTAI
ncbi:uncharacterized protein MONBRDRAFT_37693 [Monosiga brevicollis MX1]|uniref:PDZ domain-containing protein n=1 Tax=Monosiga brevicollis TaxID=81824 RepID=A9V3B6_MONBE|nr:uncharacterized protein MONBRDRAFT_37693 [Monosiga brevicollis MX1]EDQ88032.1 predicted protein [Monosiga brevicollis MX1]|eukprot:XP_001747108.1 hypothetical protein [Monosiga brevicollis MX1]